MKENSVDFDYFQNRYNRNPKLFKSRDIDIKSRDNRLKSYVYLNQAPVMIIPDSEEEFKGLHRAKFWYNLRRNWKKLEDEYDSVELKICTSECDLIQYLPQVQKLFAERWSEEYTSSPWKTIKGFQPYERAMIDLASTDEGFICIILVNNDIKIYGYVLMNTECLFLYQLAATTELAFRKYDLAGILLKSIIEYGIQKERKLLDFGIGVSAYKLKWAKELDSIYRKVETRAFFGARLLHLFFVQLLKFRYGIQRRRRLVKFIKKVL